MYMWKLRRILLGKKKIRLKGNQKSIAHVYVAKFFFQQFLYVLIHVTGVKKPSKGMAKGTYQVVLCARDRLSLEHQSLFMNLKYIQRTTEEKLTAFGEQNLFCGHKQWVWPVFLKLYSNSTCIRTTRDDSLKCMYQGTLQMQKIRYEVLKFPRWFVYMSKLLNLWSPGRIPKQNKLIG